jgi:hypothetical protein
MVVEKEKERKQEPKQEQKNPEIPRAPKPRDIA